MFQITFLVTLMIFAAIIAVELKRRLHAATD